MEVGGVSGGVVIIFRFLDEGVFAGGTIKVRIPDSRLDPRSHTFLGNRRVAPLFLHVSLVEFIAKPFPNPQRLLIDGCLKDKG